MALSGSFSQSFGSYYRVQLEWTATQNTANNTSSVTAKLYLMSTHSQANITSSSSKTFFITIDGTKTTSSGNLNLSGNQKKLLMTATKTLSHNSAGEKSMPIAGFMEFGLNLNGHTSDILIQKTETLTPIQSSSSVGTVSQWRLGDSMSVGINRKSTAYTHTVRAYIGTTLIATRTNVETSQVFTFSTAELKRAFLKMGRSSSESGSIEVDTYSGSAKIGGTASEDVVVLAAIPSTYTVSSTQSQPLVGSEVKFKIVMNNSAFDHTLILSAFGDEIGRVEVPAGVSTAYFSTAPFESQMHNIIGSRDSALFVFEVFTKYDSNVIRDSVNSSFRFYKDEVISRPIFEGTINITERSPNVTNLGAGYFLSGESVIEVRIPSAHKATAESGSIYSYSASIGNKSTSVLDTPGDIVMLLNYPYGNGGETVTITARDTDGNEVSQWRIVNILPYARPTARVKLTRRGGFEADTDGVLTSSYAPVFKGASQMNTVLSRRYRIKPQGSSWGAWVNMSTAQNATNILFNFPNTKSYTVQMEVRDRYNTATSSTVVAAGQPILFIDATKNSVGVNSFPDYNNSLKVGGDIYGDTFQDSTGFTFGGTFGDIRMNGGNVALGKNDSFTIDLGGGLFKMTPYSSDVTITTNKSEFYFQKRINAAGGISGTISSTNATIATAGIHYLSTTYTATLNGSTTINGSFYFSGNEPLKTTSERGYAGIGGIPGSSNAWFMSSAINFRVRRSYTPSSVTFGTVGGNAPSSSVLVRDITVDGCALILVSGSYTNSIWRWNGYYYS